MTGMFPSEARILTHGGEELKGFSLWCGGFGRLTLCEYVCVKEWGGG